VRLANNISSWEESQQSLGGEDWRRGSIATESQEQPTPAWDDCIDALLKLWQDPTQFDVPPSRQAIELAIQWLSSLLKFWSG